MKKKSLVLIFILMSICAGLFLFPGCASGPKFTKIQTIPDNMGLVYIYRPGKLIGGAVSYQVNANGTSITRLGSGGYYPYFAKPGEIEFSAKTESTSSITIDVKAGQTYYIKGTVGIGILMGRPHLILVPADVGEKEIVECKLLEEKK